MDIRVSPRSLASEGCLQAETGATHDTGPIEFRGDEDEVVRVTVDEVPLIALQLVMHLVEKASGAVESDRLLSSDKHAEQPIEAEKVVEMGVRYEDLLDPQNPARRQCGDIAEIEEDGAPLEQRLDEHRRITETAVDEHGMKKRPQSFCPSRACGAPRLL